MEVARADLPASLALVAYSYGPLLHEWRVCPDNPSADATLGDRTRTAQPQTPDPFATIRPPCFEGLLDANLKPPQDQPLLLGVENLLSHNYPC